LTTLYVLSSHMIVMNDLCTLEQLKRAEKASQERYAMKEQAIGLHCDQAEENLSDAELALLKKVFRLSELRWAYVQIEALTPPE
jgi:hypothetical protein